MEKAELIELLEDSRADMIDLLEGQPDAVLLEPGVVGAWSIKDVLAHLSHWEGQIVTGLFQLQNGTAQPNTVHFSGEDVDAINRRWHEEGKNRTLEMVWADWHGVRKQTIRRVAGFSEADLNDAQRFNWLKGRTLTQWVLNDSVEHEEEHTDQVRAWLQAHGYIEADEAD